MPFTPYHLGVGALGKAVLGRNFSFAVFGVTQVAMDLEPLLKLTGSIDGPVHGVTHTWPGAVVIGLAVFALWRLWSRLMGGTLFAEWRSIAPVIILVSAMFGSVSHLVLDAWMHADMTVALLSAMPDLPNMDDPGRPFVFSEAVCVLALLAAPFAWGARAFFAWINRKSDQLVIEERSPSL